MIRNVSIDDAPSSIISSKKIQMNQKQKKKRTPVFPQRLYDMLEDADEEGYSHLLGWSPDGMSFRMFYDAKNNSNTKSFIEVLKRKFNQTQFKSFLRQLQLYGFERQCKGSRKGECTHPLFQRGHKQLLQNKSIEDFQDATQNALANRIITASSCRTLLCSSLFPLTAPSVLPSVTLSSSTKEEEQDSFPPPSSTLSSSSLPLNHCLAPHYNNAASTSASVSTNVNTTDSYCTDGAATSITSKFNYLAMSTIPTKLTNLVRSNDNNNNQDNDDDNDDDDDDATAESNGSDNNSLGNNKVFNRTFVGTDADINGSDNNSLGNNKVFNRTFVDTDADTVPISRKSKVLLMCPLIWNDTCDNYDYDNDNDCDDDDDDDMREESMVAVDNSTDNDVCTTTTTTTTPTVMSHTGL